MLNVIKQIVRILGDELFFYLNQGQKDTLGFAGSICAPRWLIGRNVNAFHVLHYILERCNFL